MNAATAFGLVAVLLAILAIAEYACWISSATLGGLTDAGLAVFVVIAGGCAIAFYVWGD